MSHAPLPEPVLTRRSLLLGLFLWIAPAAAQNTNQYGECSQVERETYLQIMRQELVSNWRVPSRNRNRACTVLIAQTFRGEVLNASVEDCGDDPELIRSIEDAVYLSSPLPIPENRACFERNVRLRLVPKPD